MSFVAGRYRERARGFAISLFFLAVAAVFVLSVGIRSAVVAEQGRTLLALREELRQAEAESRRLETEVIRLQAPERVEREAIRLGMQTPRIRPVPLVLNPLRGEETAADVRPRTVRVSLVPPKAPVRAGILSGIGFLTKPTGLGGR